MVSDLICLHFTSADRSVRVTSGVLNLNLPLAKITYGFQMAVGRPPNSGPQPVVPGW